jgi:carboxypeptidase D
MLDTNDTEHYDLRGALIYDPTTDLAEWAQQEPAAVPFVLANNNLFNLNGTYIDTLKKLHESCGYAEHVEKYLRFPPSGIQPPGRQFPRIRDYKITDCSTLDRPSESFLWADRPDI